MSSALCSQVVSQAPQYSRSFEMQATCEERSGLVSQSFCFQRAYTQTFAKALVHWDFYQMQPTVASKYLQLLMLLACISRQVYLLLCTDSQCFFFAGKKLLLGRGLEQQRTAHTDCWFSRTQKSRGSDMPTGWPILLTLTVASGRWKILPAGSSSASL